MKVSQPMPPNKPTPNYRVPALEKGLDVLEILSTTPEPLSLSQVSELSGKSTSELFRTLNCLVERDYVSKDDISGKYLLTLKLFELSRRHSPLDHLLNVAEKPMEDCARALEESCHISVLRHDKIMVLAQIHPPRRVRISISVGSTFPAIRTVSGRLLFSAMDDRAVHGILTDCPTYQAMSEEEREFYWNKIYEVRKTGISTAMDESYVGLHDTAILIGNPAVGIGATLAVTQLSATQKRRDPQEVLEALVKTAKQINEQAGLAELEIMTSQLG